MAILFQVTNAHVNVGPVVTNQDVTPPAGTVAITYDVAVGNLAAPVAEDFDAWVESNDGNDNWTELARFHAGTSSQNVGRVTMQGTALRLSATCGIRTTVSVIAQTSA